MSPRARAAKTSASSPNSPSKSKTKSVPVQKTTRNSTVQKKTPVKKTPVEQPLSAITPPRQKRLSSLTASTLLQYSTSVLSPSRKLKATNQSSATKKRPISNVSENDKTDLHIPTRARREASSRASAMIMQQNEIERSRYNYSLAPQYSTSTIRRQRTVTSKNNVSPEPFKFNIPPVPPLPVPSITNLSNQTESAQSSNAVTTKCTHPMPATITTTNSKYPSLTEAILAEHNRLQKTITTKHDNLLKWTQELSSCDRLSPPYPDEEIPLESSITKTVPVHSNSKEITTVNVPTPTLLFPSSTYPLDLRSFYPLLPCWQYPSWSFQSSISVNSKTSIDRHQPSTRSKSSPSSDSIPSVHKQKKKALTFHLHTHHHHHHIHNSKPTKTTTTPFSPEKPSTPTNKIPLVESQTISSLNVKHAVENEHQSISSTTENEILNLSINNKTISNGTIKKTTRRKSSPVKRRIDSGTSPEKPPRTIIHHPPVGDEKSIRRLPKRRCVSAATTNSPNIVSITGRTTRGKRTVSASNRKRSYSPASITLPLSNNNLKKKRKTLHHWILFGKSEQQLVSIDADKPPVFRECYSSIRHTTENDVIKSNDCVILRSDTGTRQGAAPYIAKVKWFWKESTTGEIQMSLLWYYHPEHTELSPHVRKRFLPNELLASKYCDCVSAACIEDKCYVLTFNEYNRYSLREKSANLFEHSEPVGQLKFLLNKTISTVQHRPLPAKTVGNQNIFFCRYVYDYRVKRILKNPTFVTTASSM